MNHACSARIGIRSLIRFTLPLALSVLAPMQHAAAQSLQLLVPAYFYPAGAGLTYWNQLDAAASQVPVSAIFNPASGPGPTADPNYTSAINNLRTAGGQTFAYVYTNYGNRPLADVEHDVSVYLQEYPGLESGFFLDQMSNDPAEVSYYNSLYSFIKSQNSAFRVIGNPGTNAPEIYLTQPAVDTMVTIENDISAYPAYQPDPYMLSTNRDHFAHILYDEPAVAGMQSDVARAFGLNAGYVYVTDDTLPNPYDTLPSYWDQEVAAVHGLSVPEPSVTPLMIGLLGLGEFAIRRRRKQKNLPVVRSGEEN